MFLASNTEYLDVEKLIDSLNDHNTVILALMCFTSVFALNNSNNKELHVEMKQTQPTTRARRQNLELTEQL